jgi:DNA-binding HxlR family transcriptional regulator
MSSDSTAVAFDGTTGVADRPLFADPDEVFTEVQDVLGRKWHLPVVYRLLEGGPRGFSALKTAIPGISSKMLSESLSALEADGLVDREIVSERPVRVEYSLTERGAALAPVVSAVVHWGEEYGPREES